MAVTASTGIAGVNIGGSTLHSFAGKLFLMDVVFDLLTFLRIHFNKCGVFFDHLGLGLAKEKKEKLAKKIGGQTKLRWQQTDVLIIDEGTLSCSDRVHVCCTCSLFSY